MEMESNLKTIVYLTVNTVNNKIYVGIHITKDPYKFDNYWGNGITGTSCQRFKHPKTPFQRACKKYGLNAFKRYTLFVFDTVEEAQNMERQIVTEEFVNRPDTYNVALGGGAGLVPSVEIPIHRYDLNGNFMHTYRSISDAGRNTGSISGVKAAAQYKTKYFESYWSFEKVDKFEMECDQISYRTQVYYYNTKGEYIGVSPSISDFAKMCDVCTASVQRAIKNATKCGRYYITNVYVEKFDKKQTKRIRSKSYYQYDLEGNYIGEKTLEQVKSICGEEYYKIFNALKENYACCGFHWRKYKTEKLNLTKKQKKIEQYDLDGNLIKVWNSFTECQKEFSSVRQVLKGIRNSTKGYTFKYTID